jgi:hypothetical protein
MSPDEVSSQERSARGAVVCVVGGEWSDGGAQ